MHNAQCSKRRNCAATSWAARVCRASSGSRKVRALRRRQRATQIKEAAPKGSGHSESEATGSGQCTMHSAANDEIVQPPPGRRTSAEHAQADGKLKHRGGGAATSKLEAHTNVQATRSGERGRRETRVAPKIKCTRAYTPGSTSKFRPPEGSMGVTRVRSQPKSDTRSPRRGQWAAANQRAANGVPTERVGTGCASHTK